VHTYIHTHTHTLRRTCARQAGRRGRGNFGDLSGAVGAKRGVVVVVDGWDGESGGAVFVQVGKKGPQGPGSLIGGLFFLPSPSLRPGLEESPQSTSSHMLVHEE
jgi:hypothetical protein